MIDYEITLGIALSNGNWHTGKFLISANSLNEAIEKAQELASFSNTVHTWFEDYEIIGEEK